LRLCDLTELNNTKLSRDRCAREVYIFKSTDKNLNPAKPGQSA
jgi:hypothetical protein